MHVLQIWKPGLACLWIWKEKKEISTCSTRNNPQKKSLVCLLQLVSVFLIFNTVSDKSRAEFVLEFLQNKTNPCTELLCLHFYS